ncbi:FAD-containing monooxygenase EthA [Sphingomonas sp. Leaf339]|nr:FAD-containing monooxygenase EthA [Sphingomonas sp. Leaf339]
MVGAGISGISAAYHLQTRCPDRSYMIVEARAAIGGTWDLFRYPGVRSDSDMYTLGFAFRPWTGGKTIADGESIRTYVEDTAKAFGIDRHISFGVRIDRASWSSAERRWMVEGSGPEGTFAITCSFIDLCAGYYDYAAGHAPVFAGADEFEGTIVHPQHWPAPLDVTGQRVVVIGSGATAVTLVPALADKAAHVTMLQRSPSYVVAMPAVDAVATWLRQALPTKAAYSAIRAKNILSSIVLFAAARRWPAAVKRRITGQVQLALGADYDVGTHFTPRYAPWDQRVCLTPDGDLFAAIRKGDASVATDTIDRLTTKGILLRSGQELPADIIVTATGLTIKLAGGIAFAIDGTAVGFAGRLQYRGMMFDGIPNLINTFGYTNASWTLKADLTAAYLCRLLNMMRRRGLLVARPSNNDAKMEKAAFVPFSSGYIERAAGFLPTQGRKRPWRLNQNYLLDIIALRTGSLWRQMIFTT